LIQIKTNPRLHIWNTSRHTGTSSYEQAYELGVLKTLNWNLNYPNSIHFWTRVSKADEDAVEARIIAKYLLEVGCLEWRLLSPPSSLVAAASI
jgi:G2/mitotic-specific cyclin 1/2